MRNWLCWVTVHLPECSSLHQHVIKHKHEKYNMKDSLNNLDLFPYNFWDVMWTNHNGFTFPSYIQSSKNITKLPMDPVFMFQQVEAKLVSFLFFKPSFCSKVSNKTEYWFIFQDWCNQTDRLLFSKMFRQVILS